LTLAVQNVDADQTENVTHIEESQFSDVKATAIAPAKLSKTISAFANSNGGDLYIGISELRLGGKEGANGQDSWMLRPRTAICNHSNGSSHPARIFSTSSCDVNSGRESSYTPRSAVRSQ